VFAFLSVAVLWFEPWYLEWLAALGAILPSLAIADLTTLFSYTATWNYLVYIFFLFWHFPQMISGNTPVLNVIFVLLMFVAPLAYAVYMKNWALPPWSHPDDSLIIGPCRSRRYARSCTDGVRRPRSA
jgi:hypothetical protein